MNLLNRLPNSRTAPPGLERRIWRALPGVLALGTMLPAVYILLLHLLTQGGGEGMARKVEMSRYLATGAIVLNWMVVMQAAILCAIVMVMKGHAYVADAYHLPDSHAPRP